MISLLLGGWLGGKIGKAVGERLGAAVEQAIAAQAEMQQPPDWGFVKGVDDWAGDQTTQQVSTRLAETQAAPTRRDEPC